ncbi:MAG: L-threonylcarbamoyladenylate synthase [Ginsengibacter sp.]
MKKFEDDITNSINVLRDDGIILYPTDTIWGVGCDATNAIALKKIYLLKKRVEKKSMIILLAHENEIKNYVLNPSKKIIDFLSNQTTPTTAIFKNAINLPAELINKDGTIAIRIVKEDFCQMLIERLKSPLVSTSANISGDHYPKTFKEINAEIKGGVDYVVQHRQDEIKLHQASSIIKLNSDGKIEKMR